MRIFFFKTYVFVSKKIGFVTELSDNSTKRFDISSKNEINIYPGFGGKVTNPVIQNLWIANIKSCYQQLFNGTILLIQISYF